MTQGLDGVGSSARPRPVARTPLDRWHAHHGANFVERDGWRLPAAYTIAHTDRAEPQSSLRIADLSALVKFRLSATSIATLLGGVAGDGIKPGAVISIDPTDPLLACCLTSEHVLVLASTLDATGIQQRLSSLIGDRSLERHDVTCGLAGFDLIGASVATLLRRVIQLDISDRAFPPGSCCETNGAGIHVTLIRESRQVPPRMRIYVSWDSGEYLWERLFDAGHDLDITPIDLEQWHSV